MKIIVADTYEAMSKQAADDLMQLMSLKKDPLLCPASGDSPAGLYKELAERSKQDELDPSGWYFVGLDEWMGMNGTDEGSCRFHLNNELFGPLQIQKERIYFFDGRAEDLRDQCSQAEKFIATHGGIHVAVVGIGTNGHIAMNEPGTPADSRSHVADIAPETQQAGQKYFKEGKDISKGITVGLATLMEAEHIILLVSGTHKAAVIKRLISEPVSEQLPASLFRDHPSFTIYLDAAAAQLISK